MNKKPQKWHIAICVAFLLPVFAFFLLSLADTDKTFSKEENRNLATRPKLTLTSMLFGDFSEKFEDYFSDTFPLREELIGTSSVINRFYMISLKGQAIVIPGGPGEDIGEGGQTLDPNDTEPTSEPPHTYPSSPPETSPSGSTDTTTSTTPPTSTSTSRPPVTSWVPVTTDGTKPGGSGAVTTNNGILVYNGKIMEQPAWFESNLDKYAEVMNTLHARLPNVKLHVMFCPTANEFYSSRKTTQAEAMNYLYSRLDLGIIPVDAWSQLNAHTNEYIYFNTDHHWTQLGAYYAYRGFCEAAGLVPHELSEYVSHTYSNPFSGSLLAYVKNYVSAATYNALKESDYLTYFLPINPSTAWRFDNQNMTGGYKIPLVTTNFKATATVTYAGAYLQGDQPLIRIQSDTVKNGRKLLVTKESYGNALVPFLTDHFETVYVVDPRKFNGDGQNSFDLYKFIADNGVTDLLCVNYVYSAQGFSSSSSFMLKFKMMID